MEKGKLIPIIIAILLFIVAMFIFVNLQKNNKSFKKLVTSYNDETHEYANLKVDNVIVVNNTSFWVVSIDHESLVLNSSDNLLIDSKESNEFKIELNKDSKVCFADSSCVLFRLI